MGLYKKRNQTSLCIYINNGNGVAECRAGNILQIRFLLWWTRGSYEMEYDLTRYSNKPPRAYLHILFHVCATMPIVVEVNQWWINTRVQPYVTCPCRFICMASAPLNSLNIARLMALKNFENCPISLITKEHQRAEWLPNDEKLVLVYIYGQTQKRKLPSLQKEMKQLQAGRLHLATPLSSTIPLHI